MSRSKKSKGFSLIEVLIALVILSISLLALAGLMVQTTRNNSLGSRMTEAATFAQDKLEELRVSSWAGLISGSDYKDGSSSGIRYDRTWNVGTSGNLKSVSISVSWTDTMVHKITILSTLAQ